MHNTEIYKLNTPFTYFPDDNERYRIFQMKPLDIATTLDLNFNLSLRILHEIWRNGDYIKLFRSLIAFADMFGGNPYTYFSPSVMVNDTFNLMKYYIENSQAFVDEITTFYRDILSFSYLSQGVFQNGWGEIYTADLNIVYATKRGNIPVVSLSDQIKVDIENQVNLVVTESETYESNNVYLLKIISDLES